MLEVYGIVHDPETGNRRAFSLSLPECQNSLGQL